MNQLLNNGVFTASAPLRISIAGGGTDLPEYFSKHGGYWISLSIDKTVSVVLHKNIEKKFFVHYKNNEVCDDVESIKHPIIREMLKNFNIQETLSIHSVSELSGNSGLGSSSTFALCLAQCLSKISNQYISNLPDYVYNFERNILNEFVGKQDSWAAFAGGLKIYKVDTNGNMSIENLCSPSEINYLCDHMLLVKAGKQRLANDILKNQAFNLSNSVEFENKFHKTKEIAYQIADLLKQSDIFKFGTLVDKHWQNKMSAFNNDFDPEVFEVYNLLKKENAVGAKLCGAGNSGFMLSVFKTAEDVNNFIKNNSVTCVKIKPHFLGIK
jgi:D-glycero-alpha-D-manno-heptose-7-phosphate kinase